MKLFKQQERFSPKTGKKAKSELVEVGWLCDFCGKFHSADEDYSPEQTTYQVFESGEIEPQFHEMRVPRHDTISMYDLFNEHPVFQYCQDWDNQMFCELAMLETWVQGHYENARLLCHMMYDARLNMLAKLLDEKKYPLEELKLC